MNWKSMYETCKGIGLCETQYEFSRELLGRKESTFSSVMAEGRELSLASLTRLFFRMDEIFDKTKDAIDQATSDDDRDQYGGGAEVLDELLDSIWNAMREKAYA